MIKKIKKMSKIVVVLMIILAMVLTYFSPLVNVIAETYGEGDSFIKFDINDHDFPINSVTINGDAWTNANDEYHSNNHTYTIEIDVGKLGNEFPDISYCGGSCGSHFSKSARLSQEGDSYVFTIVATNPEGDFIGFDVAPGPDPTGEHHDESHFDGKAYVLWSCGSGVCYHYFDNIPNFDDGNSKFYKDTEVTADNKTGEVFNVDAEYKAWTLPDRFDFWVNAYKEQNHVESIDWTHVDPEDIISESPPDMRDWETAAINAKRCTRPAGNAPGEDWDAFENCVDDYYVEAGNLPFIRLKPVGEPSANNAYISYGDRNFKVAIYNDDYRGVTIGSLNDLDYYPAEWTNPYIRRDHFDVSDTTKNKPAPLSTILLEDEINIKALNYNGFAIKSIEPLDVPEDAVTVTKVNGEFNIAFSSNFYDNVTFKITGTDNAVYYMVIQRYTIDAWLKNDENGLSITSNFYFDRSKSYEDFEITAKVIYTDGSTETVNLEAQFGIDDEMGNMTDAYEVDEEQLEFGPPGKGLKRSRFEHALPGVEEKDIDKIYIVVEYKGSTDTNYAGAYVGSGEGVLANIYRPEEEGE